MSGGRAVEAWPADSAQDEIVRRSPLQAKEPRRFGVVHPPTRSDLSLSRGIASAPRLSLLLVEPGWGLANSEDAGRLVVIRRGWEGHTAFAGYARPVGHSRGTRVDLAFVFGSAGFCKCIVGVLADAEFAGHFGPDGWQLTGKVSLGYIW